jgi:2,4-dienoyl-CoA reductase (NADPH2)
VLLAEEGGKILMQILHAGRYGYQPLVVSASDKKSPISPFKPRALSEAEQTALAADLQAMKFLQAEPRGW